jgi:hypothetical protein
VKLFKVFTFFKTKKVSLSEASLLEREAFYAMLKKVQKKRPHFNIARVMEKVYGKGWEENSG